MQLNIKFNPILILLSTCALTSSAIAEYGPMPSATMTVYTSPTPAPSMIATTQPTVAPSTFATMIPTSAPVGCIRNIAEGDHGNGKWDTPFISVVYLGDSRITYTYGSMNSDTSSTGGNNSFTQHIITSKSKWTYKEELCVGNTFVEISYYDNLIDNYFKDIDFKDSETFNTLNKHNSTYVTRSFNPMTNQRSNNTETFEDENYVSKVVTQNVGVDMDYREYHTHNGIKNGARRTESIRGNACTATEVVTENNVERNVTNPQCGGTLGTPPMP